MSGAEETPAAADLGALLDRDAILQTQDRRFEDVFVPEWNGTVRIMELSAAGRTAWEDWVRENCEIVEDAAGKSRIAHSPPELTAVLVAVCATDANGVRLFGVDDVIALGEKSSGAIARLSDVAQRMNALRAGDGEAIQGN